jgi:vitamin-K-epoxide reductase (warfarin-sensitive)
VDPGNELSRLACGTAAIHSATSGTRETAMKTMRYLIVLLALAGMVVSILALRVHYSTETGPCSINEKWDCGVVNHSPFAEIGHIPVAAMGIAGYLMLAGLALARRRILVVTASIAGLGFALYLTHIEKDVLMVWCLYCVISQGIIAVTMLLALASVAADRIGRKHASVRS